MSSTAEDMAPTVSHFVWFPAPQGGRILPWGGPTARLAPTLVTSCTSLPPEGANFSWGGPAKNCLVFVSGLCLC